MLTCRWLIANAGAIPLSELGVEVTNGQQVWLIRLQSVYSVALVALLRLLHPVAVNDSQASQMQVTNDARGVRGVLGRCVCTGHAKFGQC